MAETGEVVICNQFQKGNCDGRRCGHSKSHLRRGEPFGCDDICIIEGKEVHQECVPITTIVRRAS